MRTAIVALMLLSGVPAAADEKKGRKSDEDGRYGIPAGHLPPPGECRIWYEGVPPGHQPPPFKCDEGYRVERRTQTGRYGRYENGGYRNDEPRGGVSRGDQRDVEPYDGVAQQRTGRRAQPRAR